MRARMGRRVVRSSVAAGLAVVLIAVGSARGQGHHGHGGGSMHSGPTQGPVVWPTVGHHHGRGPWPRGGFPGYGFGLGAVFIPVVYPPIPIATGPVGGGLFLPDPLPREAALVPNVRVAPKADPSKAEGYVRLGDNLFRAGNTHRAEQRYLQAARARPNWATPYVRLAQVALNRGDYRDAADQIRKAMGAEPGWLVNATDVQALFAEPGDFARALAKLESHLQAEPADRDGWLVLGAEWYLSGRGRQAADVFARLNDRKPDAALAAFLDATTPDALAREAR